MAEEQPEKTAEEKAREAKLILQEQLKLLGEAETERLAKVRGERELDEARGRERAAELFPEGSLGRIQEGVSAETQGLLGERRDLLGRSRAEAEGDIARRQAGTSESLAAIDELIAAREGGDLAKLQRSEGREQINKALQSQLAQIRAQGNLQGSGVTQALVGDALGGALGARAQLERDLILGGRKAVEDLTLQRESARERGLGAGEVLGAQKRGEEDAARRRLEDLQGAIERDVLSRQLVNLDNRSRELFGRLGVEQNLVAQGVAERSGVRQQILAETSQAEATRAQREAERLREIESGKEAPSGGGKIICGELYAQGLLPVKVYLGDMIYAQTVSDDTRNGYLAWSRYYVKAMQKSKLATMAIYPLARGWATEMAYRAGTVDKGSWVGKVLSWTGEPICNLIGKVRRWCGLPSLVTKIMAQKA